MIRELWNRLRAKFRVRITIQKMDEPHECPVCGSVVLPDGKH